METINSESYPFSSRCQNLPSSFIRDILKVADQKDMISFAGGLPDASLFPLDDLEASAASVFKNQGAKLLQYSNSDGLRTLKQLICHYYHVTFKMRVKPDQILITSGSQQGLDLISKAFINTGDEIILEQPSYLGAIQAFSAYEPDILPVKIEADGINLEELEEILKAHQPKFLYLVPNFQNPSGFSISEEKRVKLAALAQLYKFIIVEDDPYGQIRFEGEDPKPIRYYSENAILCGSFSKIIAPGLRIGWIVANEAIIRKLLILRQASDLHSNNLSQYIADHYLRNFDFKKHLDKIKESYAAKCNFMYEALLKHFPGECKFYKPEGGMFLWVELPEYMEAELLLTNSMEEKVIFVPGKYFYSNGKGKNTMRLNFTNSSIEEIKKGIAILGSNLRDIYSLNAMDRLEVVQNLKSA